MLINRFEGNKSENFQLVDQKVSQKAVVYQQENP